MELTEQRAIITSNTPEICSLIETAGRVCHKSEDKINKNSYKAFIKKIIEMGHESVLEHGTITVNFFCDRGVSHELVRHRLASYSQESTRYCNYYSENIKFIIPCWINVKPGIYTENTLTATDTTTVTWFQHMLASEKAYKDLMLRGWAPQHARSVLPNSLQTEVFMTANVREWRHVLRLRTSERAHPQIRDVMLPLLKTFHKQFYPLFHDIEDGRFKRSNKENVYGKSQTN